MAVSCADFQPPRKSQKSRDTWGARLQEMKPWGWSPRFFLLLRNNIQRKINIAKQARGLNPCLPNELAVAAHSWFIRAAGLLGWIKLKPGKGNPAEVDSKPWEKFTLRLWTAIIKRRWIIYVTCFNPYILVSFILEKGERSVSIHTGWITDDWQSSTIIRWFHLVSLQISNIYILHIYKTGFPF